MVDPYKCNENYRSMVAISRAYEHICADKIDEATALVLDVIDNRNMHLTQTPEHRIEEQGPSSSVEQAPAWDEFQVLSEAWLCLSICRMISGDPAAVEQSFMAGIATCADPLRTSILYSVFKTAYRRSHSGGNWADIAVRLAIEAWGELDPWRDHVKENWDLSLALAASLALRGMHDDAMRAFPKGYLEFVPAEGRDVFQRLFEPLSLGYALYWSKVDLKSWGMALVPRVWAVAEWRAKWSYLIDS